jgi:Holliday junction resolvasome RuvABC DNA-binding subunit
MAANLGPLVALKGSLSREHRGIAWPLSNTQLLLETERSELYLIDFLSERKLRHLEEHQGPVWVYIAQVIREDALQYFGFASALERSLFEELKEIKDVGPKIAATLAAELEPRDLLRLMQEGAWAGLKIAGVGPKTLESVVFGLNKRKKNILPLLERAQQVARPLGQKNSTKIQSAIAEESVPAWRPSLYPSSSLLQMFEGLGMAPAQTQKLYQECCDEVEGFKEFEDRARVPVMLQRWGQNKTLASSARRAPLNESSEGLS